MKEYIRVGTEYFKQVNSPLISGDISNKFMRWNKQTIVDDFGKESIGAIKKYEAFCTIPSHIDYKREINNFYNKYEPISYEINKIGDWQNIEMFLKHLFTEQYEIGLDYLTILWKHPIQILPILCFVSAEKNTGKSTFLNLMKLIFESNITINTNEDFRSKFNSDWANKLIIAVDEVLLDKKEDSERIKNLSTASHFKSEAKGVDKAEIEFFGKFILCSNNVENFIKVDDLEIRYWVIKVNPFEKENPDLLTAMRKEISAFGNFLTNRNIQTKRTTRMWFSKEQIHTTALDVLVRGNRTTIEKEIEEFLIDEFSIIEVEELCYTATDLVLQLKIRNINVSNSYVSKILKEHYKLVATNNSYKLQRIDYSNSITEKFSIYTENKKGRFYTFQKKDFIKAVD